MKVVPVEGATLTLPQLEELVKNGPVILTRNGQPLLAVNDVSGSDWESVALASNPQFLAIIEESRRSYRDEGGIPLDDLRRELGLDQGKRRSKHRDPEPES